MYQLLVSTTCVNEIIIQFRSMMQFFESQIDLFFSVILYANHAAFTGIAIFFHTICIRMVTEDKSKSPPRIFKFIFRGIFLKILGLSEYEVK